MSGCAITRSEKPQPPGRVLIEQDVPTESINSRKRLDIPELSTTLARRNLVTNKTCVNEFYISRLPTRRSVTPISFPQNCGPPSTKPTAATRASRGT